MLWYLLEASQMGGLPATYVFMEKYEKILCGPHLLSGSMNCQSQFILGAKSPVLNVLMFCHILTNVLL